MSSGPRAGSRPLSGALSSAARPTQAVGQAVLLLEGTFTLRYIYSGVIVPFGTRSNVPNFKKYVPNVPILGTNLGT